VKAHPNSGVDQTSKLQSAEYSNNNQLIDWPGPKTDASFTTKTNNETIPKKAEIYFFWLYRQLQPKRKTDASILRSSNLSRKRQI